MFDIVFLDSGPKKGQCPCSSTFLMSDLTTQGETTVTTSLLSITCSLCLLLTALGIAAHWGLKDKVLYQSSALFSDFTENIQL